MLQTGIQKITEKYFYISADRNTQQFLRILLYFCRISADRNVQKMLRNTSLFLQTAWLKHKEYLERLYCGRSARLK